MISTLTRIFGVEHLDLVEDVVQDALLKALNLWPYHGVPANPSAWIVQVAKNRALDRLRRQSLWSEKEAQLKRHQTLAIPETTPLDRRLLDDQLHMMLVCCHPELSRDAQVALTLKTVGGFSVPEISRAFLVKPQTVAQRLVRAKKRLRELNVRFAEVGDAELSERLDSLLEILYLMFNEGFCASEGEALVRLDLCSEAIRLTRLVVDHPAVQTPEVDALMALFLFQSARTRTRIDGAGDPVLLQSQDRSLWDRDLIGQATLSLRRSGRGKRLTRYHLEAEIASHHALADSYQETDWQSILDCYDALLDVNPSPVVAVNRLVPLLQVRGPECALAESNRLVDSPALDRYYPAQVVRAEILAAVGRNDDAGECLARALELAPSDPVRRSITRFKSSLYRPPR